tara:strand:+ start:57 stop:206 length:150 start_codon:yes stop_codon:yes gene_type:complete
MNAQPNILCNLLKNINKNNSEKKYGLKNFAIEPDYFQNGGNQYAQCSIL